MKAYTDIEQSMKLAEILPLESADMDYIPICNLEREYSINVNIWNNDHIIDEGWIPCWSLAALINVLKHPRCFQGDKPIYWFCGCFGKDELYHEVEADNPVDACYKMVLELHKLNLL